MPEWPVTRAAGILIALVLMSIFLGWVSGLLPSMLARVRPVSPKATMSVEAVQVAGGSLTQIILRNQGPGDVDVSSAEFVVEVTYSDGQTVAWSGSGTDGSGDGTWSEGELLTLSPSGLTGLDTNCPCAIKVSGPYLSPASKPYP